MHRLFGPTLIVLVLTVSPLPYAEALSSAHPTGFRRGEIARVASNIEVNEARKVAIEELTALSNGPPDQKFGIARLDQLKDATLGEPFLDYSAGEEFSDYEQAEPSEILEFMRALTIRFPVILGDAAVGTIDVLLELETGRFKRVSDTLGPTLFNKVARVRERYPESQGWDVSVANTGLGTYIVLKDATGQLQLSPANRSASNMFGLDPDNDNSLELVPVDAAWEKMRLFLSTMRRQEEGRVENLLTYDDLVFIGLLRSFDVVSSTNGEWGFKDDPAEGKLTMATLTFSVQEVLKGTWASKKITILTLDLGFATAMPRSALVSAYYSPGVLGGRYIIRDKGEVMTPSGAFRSWESLNGKVSMTFPEIRELIEKTHPIHLARNDDLVAECHLIGVSDSTVWVHEREQSVVKVHAEVLDLLSGSAQGKDVYFLMPKSMLPSPPWAHVYPRDIAVGQDWIVFLRRAEFGLYPWAGSNGMLRVEGEDLIYDERVVRPVKRGDLIQLIRTDAGNERRGSSRF